MADRQKLMYQLFAIFMIASMALSGLAYFIGFGLTSSSNSGATNGNDYSSQQPQLPTAIGFDDVGGILVDADFNSISDALKITPQGIVTAQFTNVEKSEGTLLHDIAAQGLPQKELYNENVGNSYGAVFEEGNVIYYHIVPSESLNFGYIVDPTPYRGYNLLMRENGLRNVVGTPVMLADPATTYKSLDVISGEADSAYNRFAPILNYSSSEDIIAYLDTDIPLASIFYSGFRMGADTHADAGKGTRTLIYQDISVNASSKIDALANNGTDAIDVIVETYGEENITVVKLVSDLNSLFMAEIG